MILGTTEKPTYGAKENTIDIRKPNNQKNDSIQWSLQALDGLALDPVPKYITTAISVLFQADSGMLIKK
jgi:hypothetical protein